MICGTSLPSAAGLSMELRASRWPTATMDTTWQVKIVRSYTPLWSPSLTPTHRHPICTAGDVAHPVCPDWAALGCSLCVSVFQPEAPPTVLAAGVCTGEHSSFGGPRDGWRDTAPRRREFVDSKGARRREQQCSSCPPEDTHSWRRDRMVGADHSVAPIQSSKEFMSVTCPAYTIISCSLDIFE